MCGHGISPIAGPPNLFSIYHIAIIAAQASEPESKLVVRSAPIISTLILGHRSNQRCRHPLHPLAWVLLHSINPPRRRRLRRRGEPTHWRLARPACGWCARSRVVIASKEPLRRPDASGDAGRPVSAARGMECGTEKSTALCGPVAPRETSRRAANLRDATGDGS